MLKVFQSGGEQWCEFTKFDDNGRAILFANPSAVNGYDDAFADLLDYDSGSNTYLYLNDHAGLIRAVTYVRWTTFQYTDCCLTASQRVYHKIPSTGTGSSGTNFDATDFGYSVMKRRNRTVTPGGTITDIVYDPRGLVLATYVGTNGG